MPPRERFHGNVHGFQLLGGKNTYYQRDKNTYFPDLINLGGWWYFEIQ